MDGAATHDIKPVDLFADHILPNRLGDGSCFSPASKDEDLGKRKDFGEEGSR
jgi:hypothetical protein